MVEDNTKKKTTIVFVSSSLKCKRKAMYYSSPDGISVWAKC
jgi:hypothetical protein